jgi:hypothetical protein
LTRSQGQAKAETIAKEESLASNQSGFAMRQELTADGETGE